MDKNLPFLLAFAVILVCFTIMTGCITDPNTNTSLSLSDTGLPPSENPRDYFPMDAGNQWDYKVQIYGDYPLLYQETSWPVNSEKALVYSTRGIYYQANDDKTHELSFRVKGIVPEQGPFRIAKGVELEILKDSLQIFGDDDVTGVYWVPFEDRFMINLVTTYSPHSMGAPYNSWGGWGQEDGHSRRIVFFASEPGTGIRAGDSSDSTLFTGIDYNAPGYQGSACLHFLRQVEADEEPSQLGKSFTEDMWYAKGKGLVLLEQKIEGKTSMTWTLEKFYPKS